EEGQSGQDVPHCAPIAQLDRASDYESKGRMRRLSPLVDRLAAGMRDDGAVGASQRAGIAGGGQGLRRPARRHPGLARDGRDELDRGGFQGDLGHGPDDHRVLLFIECKLRLPLNWDGGAERARRALIAKAAAWSTSSWTG